MFHWICPECGREIAPQVKECPNCEPSPVEAAPLPPVVPELPAQPIRFEPKPEPLLLAAPAAPPEPVPAPAPVLKVEPPPAPVPEPEPAALQPRLTGAPRPPASALPNPIQIAGRDIGPVDGVATMLARTVVRNPHLPDLELAAAPQITHAPLRAPEAARPPATWSDVPSIAAGPELGSFKAKLLEPTAPSVPGPAPAPLLFSPAQTLASLKPAKLAQKQSLTPPHEQITLPGPTLPHELTSLEAAGVARILVAAGAQKLQRKSSWFLSLMVASAILAVSLATMFYAVPTLAGPSTPPEPVKTVAKAPPEPVAPALPAIPDNPLARRIEVTGIRFVTDIPNQRPEIHYLVVNHSSEPLANVTVSVTLRSLEGDGPMISRFSFLTPRLRPYESKEMASSIERINRPVSLPDWRRVRADVEVTQQ